MDDFTKKVPIVKDTEWDLSGLNLSEAEVSERLTSEAMQITRETIEKGDIPVIAHIGRHRVSGEWILNLMWPLSGDTVEVTTAIPQTPEEAEALLQRVCAAYMLAQGWIDKDGKNLLF